MSNNLEAIELLKTCAERLQDQGFSSHGNTVSELNKAIDLLQADEDIEVQETANLIANAKMDSIRADLYRPTIKPTKETKQRKLTELSSEISHQRKVDYLDFVQLLDILLEEEY